MGRKKNNKYDLAYEIYLSGLSLQQVASQLKVTRQCLYNSFKRRGFSLRGVNFKPFQEYDGKKFTLRNTGYYSLTTNDRTLMHRYIWEKEKGIIPDNHDIHHINGNKSDNRIENLECLSKSEHTRLYCEFNNQFGKGRRPIEALDFNGIVVKSFPNTTIAAKEMGVNRSAINNAINGKQKTCCKLKWRYASN